MYYVLNIVLCSKYMIVRDILINVTFIFLSLLTVSQLYLSWLLAMTGIIVTPRDVSRSRSIQYKRGLSLYGELRHFHPFLNYVVLQNDNAFTVPEYGCDHDARLLFFGHFNCHDLRIVRKQDIGFSASVYLVTICCRREMSNLNILLFLFV